MFQKLSVVATIATVLCGASGSANAATFVFTNFDGPGNNGGGTTVNGINNNGQAVGFSSDNAETPTVLTNFVRNANGVFTTLNVNGDPLAMANGINKAGVIVGATSTGSAFRLGSSFTTLPTLPVATSLTAFGINDNGLIVGQFTDGVTDTQPGFLLNGNIFTILNPTATATVTNAQSVNNNGLVTGFYSSDGVHQHGFFFNSVTNTFTIAPDPTVANLELVQFLGINDAGIVSGYYQTNDGSQHGLLYNSNTRAYTFLDDPNAATAGFSITQITGINNAGQIDGFYVDSASGLQRGFIASPVTATPEPATFALVGLLLPVLATRSLLRKK